ncbi:MAG TPA: hypothetical protein VE820_01110 [Sphingomicrobium sp.]|nr:hypothetical protein [Sphingomicrobium sp.]
MRALMLITLAAVIASCSRPVTPPEDRFAHEIEGRTAGPPQTCVTTYPNQNIRVIDAQTLAYGSGTTIYINRLGATCPGLGELNTTIVSGSTGSQYCRGDHVRGLEIGATIPGPPCNLGDWVPYRKP